LTSNYFLSSELKKLSCCDIKRVIWQHCTRDLILRL